MEAGNAFLPAFMERFNGRFAVVPAKPNNLHRKIHLPKSRLTDILCHREQRYLSAQLSFHYDRRQIILERKKTSEELAGKYVDLYDYTDGRLEVRWKGITPPYRVFAKDQRIMQTAIVENKRLSHALSLVKAQQELMREVKVLTNSEKDGYKKRPRQVYGPNFIEKPRMPRAVEMTG